MERTAACAADEAITDLEVNRPLMGTFGTPSVDRLERLGPSAFSGTALHRPGTWVVAFLADWCGFCREFAPLFEELGSDHVHLAIGDLSRNSNPLWDVFAVELVPTVIVFRNGKPVHRLDARPSEGLGPEDVARLRELLAHE